MPEAQAHRQPGPDTPFEIGLVMAGAISAGAYTAGVIDFLVEALDEWEKAKEFARLHPDDPQSAECPMHSVKLKVMAGASAGGMTSGLAAGLLGMDYQSVVKQPESGQPVAPSNNNLYRSWVNTIDIDPLLKTDDLDGADKGPVQSVLDCTILQKIADNAFAFENPAARKTRPYVSDPLHVFLAVTNLRGVPYPLRFANQPDEEEVQPYEMTWHADHMHFILSENEPTPDQGAFWLKPYDFKNETTWGLLQKTALATGAFPVGLAPILLKRLSTQYDLRDWRHKGPHEENGKHFCEYWKPIPPDFGNNNEAFEYDFLCVDGGVTNNEPLDLADLVLTGPLEVEPTDGDKVSRATIMILPFPNTSEFSRTYDGRTNLMQLLPTTFRSLISQSRFKPEELARAINPKIYNRYLVVPRRGYRPDGTPEPFTIACGSLGGFGGFLSRKFREHDYQLGRRNCQWFLKHYFTLPSEGEKPNPLFDDWTPEARAKFTVTRSTNPAEKMPILPVIPLMGSAAPTVAEPVWPSFTEAEFQALRPKIKKRLSRVVRSLVDDNIEGFLWGPLARWALKSAWWFQGGKVVDQVMKTIRDDLTVRKIMEP